MKHPAISRDQFLVLMVIYIALVGTLSVVLALQGG